jgi:thiosulfate/3-mercaptopyruvate sulfurtransferase
MKYHTLIDVDTVAAHLTDPAWVRLDCRFELTRPEWGETSFREGHLPGAQYAHLDRDLAAAPTASSGRHPLPSAEVFARLAGAWGIDESVQVVVYDQGSGVYAARAWWLLRWLGHEKVALMSGGLEAWRSTGHALESGEARQPRARTFTPHEQPGWVVDVEQVLKATQDPTQRIVDARGADRFAGQNESMDPVAGHVPAAVNHPFMRNVGPGGHLLPAAELRARWQETLAGHPPSSLIAMCGSGVSACLNLLALEHAGLHGGRLYPGSWSEWVRDPSRPVEKS